MNEKTKKILGITLDVVLSLFLVFAVLTTVLAYLSSADKNKLPSLFGRTVVAVRTNSMSPTFNEGDLLFGRTVTAEEAKDLPVGTIITYMADVRGTGEKEANTHRITARASGTEVAQYYTKGDNNPLGDQESGAALVDSKQILCVWDESDGRIAGLGRFILFLKDPTGFLCLVVIPMGIFFLAELVRFVLLVNKERNAGKRQITAEDEEEIKRKAVEEYLKAQAEAQAPETKEPPADK